MAVDLAIRCQLGRQIEASAVPLEGYAVNTDFYAQGAIDGVSQDLLAAD